MKLLLSALFTLSLLAQNPERERVLGKMLAEEIRRHQEPFGQPAVEAYLDRIGSQLTSQLPADTFEYHFEIMRANLLHEPVSLPGGHIFVPTTFFLSAQNEDEFATMLAHAIGHIEQYQAFANIARSQGLVGGTANIPLIFLGGGGMHAEPARWAASIMPAQFLGLQREKELGADRFAINLAGRAGFNASALRDYIQRTQPQNASRFPALPPREQRLELLSHAPATSPSWNKEFLRCQEAVREAVK